MTRRKCRKIIIEFLNRLKQYHNEEYLKKNEDRIDALEWLLAYYEGRTASTAKQLLEVMLRDSDQIDQNIKNRRFIWVDVIYNFIYNKQMTGF